MYDTDILYTEHNPFYIIIIELHISQNNSVPLALPTLHTFDKSY